jgi:hypothetical protein
MILQRLGKPVHVVHQGKLSGNYTYQQQVDIEWVHPPVPDFKFTGFLTNLLQTHFFSYCLSL